MHSLEGLLAGQPNPLDNFSLSLYCIPRCPLSQLMKAQLCGKSCSSLQRYPVHRMACGVRGRLHFPNRRTSVSYSDSVLATGLDAQWRLQSCLQRSVAASAALSHSSPRDFAGFQLQKSPRAFFTVAALLRLVPEVQHHGCHDLSGEACQRLPLRGLLVRWLPNSIRYSLCFLFRTIHSLCESALQLWPQVTELTCILVMRQIFELNSHRLLKPAELRAVLTL